MIFILIYHLSDFHQHIISLVETHLTTPYHRLLDNEAEKKSKAPASGCQHLYDDLYLSCFCNANCPGIEVVMIPRIFLPPKQFIIQILV